MKVLINTVGLKLSKLRKFFVHILLPTNLKSDQLGSDSISNNCQLDPVRWLSV